MNKINCAKRGNGSEMCWAEEEYSYKTHSFVCVGGRTADTNRSWFYMRTNPTNEEIARSVPNEMNYQCIVIITASIITGSFVTGINDGFTCVRFEKEKKKVSTLPEKGI